MGADGVVQLPRDEHAAPGRARRDRGSDRASISCRRRSAPRRARSSRTSCPPTIEVRGHAIQARVYAEDPKNFFPSPGKLTVFRPPQAPGVRVETGFAEGRDVTPHYDPMIAKVIAHADTRERGDRQADRGARSVRDPGPQAQHPRGARDPALGAVPRGATCTRVSFPKCSARRSNRRARHANARRSWTHRQSCETRTQAAAARALDEAAGKALLAQLRHRGAEDGGRARRRTDVDDALQGAEAAGRRQSRLARHPAQERRRRRQGEPRSRRTTCASAIRAMAALPKIAARARRRLADRGDGAAGPGDRRRRPARSRSSGRSSWSGLGGIFVEVLADVVVPHLPDHAARRRRDARRAQRRGAARKARAAASPRRARRSSTCC